ncbi:hypothetical protein [Pseudomonas sp.]|uniref:hypothetical protein n=1 Tax=Pseudomonas sp. TaxID=306 RepID=UPI00290ABFFD|nr:hypothetical protein [Pseudomonas sp.]MDU4254561.1 hypothetical protein [Pseudomonas sp.]
MAYNTAKQVGLESLHSMWSLRPYFVRGMKRIVLALIAAASGLVITNLIGYQLDAHGASLVDAVFAFGTKSYIARALSLSLNGLINVTLYALSVLAAGLLLVFAAWLTALAYRAVCFIGGHRATRPAQP